MVTKFYSNCNKILIQNPKINKKIIRISSVSEDEKIDLYNLSDVFILPSKFEGFGIVFIESLACGLKVIASDGYGCREGLLDGDLGTLINPDSTDGIAKAIIDELKISKTKESKIILRNKTIQIYGKKNWEESCYDSCSKCRIAAVIENPRFSFCREFSFAHTSTDYFDLKIF